MCGGSSLYVSTASRLSSFHNAHFASKTCSTSSTTTTIASKHQPLSTTSLSKGNNLEASIYSPPRKERPSILQDITNKLNSRPMPDPIRPDERELSLITQVNYMLSNFVVSYFFTILARNFNNIVYSEFLFDVVMGEGGWRSFVTKSQSEGRYATFFNALQQTHSTCIIPICHNLHWTILVRMFVGRAWIIYFIDSIQHNSDQRFQQWKAIFQDDNLFTGEWCKVKIIQQSELECGARVCLHGLCFALSTRNSAGIMSSISRISNLAARSRLMVSRICKEGKWSPQGWLNPVLKLPLVPSSTQASMS
jgi:hypothetical protein